MIEVLGVILLILICLLGVLVTVVRLPGTWLIVVAALVFGWLDAWERMPLLWVGVLTGIALVGEGVELLASFVTAKKAGGTREAAWGGLIGGFVGMLFLSVPLPLLGTFIGAILGCFLGATIAELWVHNQLGRGTRVGFFSALGFAIGAAAKVGFAMAMAGITIVRVLWPAAAVVDPTTIGQS